MVIFSEIVERIGQLKWPKPRVAFPCDSLQLRVNSMLENECDRMEEAEWKDDWDEVIEEASSERRSSRE